MQQEPSIFTKIVRGDIPSHKIYEDNDTLAFLNIYPSQPGHTLVIPKVEVSRLEDLPDHVYANVMTTLKKVMQKHIQVFGPDYRACIKVMGFDVPHAHIHVIPCKTARDFYVPEDTTVEPDHAALAEMAKKLAI